MAKERKLSGFLKAVMGISTETLASLVLMGTGFVVGLLILGLLFR
jgi:hypothetical protein